MAPPSLTHILCLKMATHPRSPMHGLIMLPFEPCMGGLMLDVRLRAHLTLHNHIHLILLTLASLHISDTDTRYSLVFSS